MDTLSHGLWGGAAFYNKSRKRFWLAFGFGVAPDILSFGVYFVERIFSALFLDRELLIGRPEREQIPTFVHSSYDVTHSFVVFLVVFLAVWALRRAPLWEMLAWPLHILVDIPTHSIRFFPTPFLWPLSDFAIDGTPWSTWWIFFPNVALLVILYSFLWFRARRKRLAGSVENI